MSHLTFHSHFPTQSIGAIRWAVRLLLLALLSLLIASCTGTTPSEITDLSLLIVGGDQQRGPAGAELPQPLTVKAVGPRGELLHGIVVNFRVTSGGGSVFAGSAVTNRDGRASEYWTLGFDSTPQVLEVRAVSAAGAKEVFGRFTATVTGGGGSARVVSQAGDSQVAPVGTAVALAPAVRVTDTLGRPWMGVPVVFDVLSGGGSISGDTTFTDSAGIAAVGSWTLGPLPGANTLRATAARSGIAGNPVNFSAQGFQAELRTVRSGWYHTCALTTGGSPVCWGDNTKGQLGDGTLNPHLTPVTVSGGLSLIGLATGDYHSCGLGAAGAAYCWGDNGSGQLGDGSTVQRLTPTAVAGGLTFVAITAGGEHTCGLTGQGAAWCWGQNNWGQLGEGTSVYYSRPHLVSGGLRFIAMAAGRFHTCGLISDGAAYCWGWNAYGQLGDGTSLYYRLLPGPVAGGLRYAGIEAGRHYVCALPVGGGTTHCWGYNGNGELGMGDFVNRLVPTPMSGGRSLAVVAGGGMHGCGQMANGDGYCWGYNGWGAIGSGDPTIFLPAATAIAGGLTFADLAAGEFHSCGVTVGARMYCWGNNGNGQLGDGGTTSQFVPVPVSGNLTFLVRSGLGASVSARRHGEVARAGK